MWARQYIHLLIADSLWGLEKLRAAMNCSMTHRPSILPYHETSLRYGCETLLQTLARLRGVPIVVIGDLMLDAYTTGSVVRISPEAPVPILEDRGTHYKLGGAGNVLANLKRLGVQPQLFAVVGDDKEGQLILELLADMDIASTGVHIEKGRQTTVKHRIVAQQQQLLRIDREERRPLSQQSLASLMKQLHEYGADIKGALFSDYAKGMFTAQTFSQFTSWAQKYKLYVTLDPKETHFHFYQGIQAMTPNFKEALSFNAGLNNGEAEYQQRQPFVLGAHSLAELETLGTGLRKRHQLEQLLITLSEHGIAFFSEQEPFRLLPTFPRAVHDVSGAGDTVIAVYTAVYLVSGDALMAALLANLAASVAVSEFGTFAVGVAKLETELHRRACTVKGSSGDESSALMVKTYKRK